MAFAVNLAAYGTGTDVGIAETDAVYAGFVVEAGQECGVAAQYPIELTEPEIRVCQAGMGLAAKRRLSVGNHVDLIQVFGAHR